MMKKVFLLIVGITSFAIGHSQLKYGVKGGFNFANVGGEDVDNNKARIKFHLGGYLEASLTDKVSIRPELYYSGQGVTIESPGADYKYNLDYLNLPVLLKYNFSSGFFAETGPQLGFLLSAKRKHDGDKINVKDFYKKVDFAWVFGLGYQPPSSKIGVDARFNLGLSRLDEDGDGKSFNRVIQLGIFYELGRAGK